MKTTQGETQETARKVPTSSLSSGYDLDEYMRRPGHDAPGEGPAAPAPFPAPTSTPKPKVDARAPFPAPTANAEARPLASNGYGGGGVTVASPISRWAEQGGEEPAPPKKSWLDGVREAVGRNPALVLVALVVITVIGIVIFSMSRGPKTTPISKIKKQAREFDGQTVTVMGRVGEVYQIGGSYTFYLHQGRDTIVVFSRTRIPVSRERLTLVGSISTGYLEGVPRVALFESGP